MIALRKNLLIVEIMIVQSKSKKCKIMLAIGGKGEGGERRPESSIPVMVSAGEQE